jgi:hypothetical protein
VLLLNEGGQFQTEPRPIAHHSGGMMMSDDLDGGGTRPRTMAMVKFEIVTPPTVEERKIAELAIMVAGNQHDLARFAEAFHQPHQLIAPGTVVHEVAEQEQVGWLVVRQ